MNDLTLSFNQAENVALEAAAKCAGLSKEDFVKASLMEKIQRDANMQDACRVAFRESSIEPSASMIQDLGL